MECNCKDCKDKSCLSCGVNRNTNCSLFKTSYTQFDRIKNMSIDEMVCFICEISNTCVNIDYSPQCMSCNKEWCSENHLKEWLESEVD